MLSRAMPQIVLRPYQTEAVEQLRAGIRGGHRAQVLYMPTGAGKSVVAAHLMAEAYSKGSRAAFLVDRTVLVEQFSSHLDAWGIPHGVVMAGHWRYRPHERIQVASAQTIEARGFFPGLDLLIVDECHAVRKSVSSVIENRADFKVLGLSATPLTKGLGLLYSNVVTVRTTNELIAEGALVPLHVYAAIAPDMAGAKTVAGEWSDKEVEVRGTKIIGDIVAEWCAKTALHFGGPVKTLCFSATVKHGLELCRAFNAVGHRFEQISYKDSSTGRRQELMDEFRKPNSSIVGLVSCEALARGTDVPDVMCGIGARPYRKSLSAHIQQIGRVMRPAPEKSFALWLDHASNWLRFAADQERLFAHGVRSLDDSDLDSKARPEPTEEEVKARKCPACGYVMPASADRCPACGHERPKRSLVETAPGLMVLINGSPKAALGRYDCLADPALVWRQLAHLALERKGGDVEAAQRFAQAQYRNIYGEFARARVDQVKLVEPGEELKGLVQSQIIRWARSKYGAQKSKPKPERPAMI